MVSYVIKGTVLQEHLLEILPATFITFLLSVPLQLLLTSLSVNLSRRKQLTSNIKSNILQVTLNTNEYSSDDVH